MSVVRSGVLYKTAEEVAAEYHKSIHHVRFLARKWRDKKPGGLPCIKVGREWLFNAKRVDALWRMHREDRPGEEVKESINETAEYTIDEESLAGI